MKKQKVENWEKEFELIPDTDTLKEKGFENIKSFIRRLLKSETKKIIQEFIESKRCLHCGKLKENWQGDLSSWCDRCLEEE